jgi:flavin-dependent dehydrogenase
MERKDVWIAGGGLAGLTAGIHLARRGVSVGIIEKSAYPRHKVCGEYLSREVLPYFMALGIDLQELSPHPIDHFQLSAASGKSVRCRLPLGGLGVSRFALDSFLAEKAHQAGCEIVYGQVSSVEFSGKSFEITAGDRQFESAVVLGACGKRSSLDARLHRDFLKKRTPWLAVKTHYDVPFPDGLVGLHHFPGGYAGMSKTETGAVNFCYLAHSAQFSDFKDIRHFTEDTVFQNPVIARMLKTATPLFGPLAISQVSFEPKPTAESHILMLGDMAGVIHPMCGNGMAMAVHSAKLAAENALSFLDGNIVREAMEKNYDSAWRQKFSRRLWAGRRLAALFRHRQAADIAMHAVSGFPPIFRQIVRSTHGKPIYS